MMTLAMVMATMIEQDIAIVITMVILMVTKNQAKTDDAGEGAEEHGQDDPQVKSCSHLGDVYPLLRIRTSICLIEIFLLDFCARLAESY